MFTIPFDTKRTIPYYQQIYNYIREEILKGTLLAGDKLPSSRGLASFHNISRNTVDIAYEQLLAEGYIEALPRKGYFVCDCKNQILYSKDTPVINSEINTEPLDSSSSPYVFDFSPDSVDLSHFPYSVWRKLSKESQNNSDLFLLGDHQGDFNLRHAIATYLHSSRGVHGKESQIIIGAGVDYLLQLLSILFQRNTTIAMEAPSYARARNIFSNYGYSIADIPLDTNGIMVNTLEASKASICYVTPAHQYPLGMVMPVKRRGQLLAWADESPERYIIEDDHDSEFRYHGKPIPSLQGIDHSQKVIYIGTFSKAIAPAIRVGYMVLPPSLLARYHELCSYLACSVSRIDQDILAHFIQDGFFEKHLNRMRKIYKTKHDKTVAMLKKRSDLFELQGENTGLYFILKLKKASPSLKGKALEDFYIQKAKNYGIYLEGLASYYAVLPRDYKPSFLLGFGGQDDAAITNGMTLLIEKVFS